MKKTRVVHAAVVVALLGAAFLQAQAQTYIRAVLPNPSQEPAIGYRFQIVTPGEVTEAVAQEHSLGALRDARKQDVEGGTGEARLQPAVLKNTPPRPIAGLRNDDRTMSFRFGSAVSAKEGIDLRVAFTPRDYWRVYFHDVFEYAGGRSQRSRIPYAAFFIDFTPTSTSGKVRASLTVVNNIASTYGIPSSVINDEDRRPINFRNARVYVNNNLSRYDLMHFDQPDGPQVDLPNSFTLKAGEAQTFDLGLMDADSYVLTTSEISYDGADEYYVVACAHRPQ